MRLPPDTMTSQPRVGKFGCVTSLDTYRSVSREARTCKLLQAFVPSSEFIFLFGVIRPSAGIHNEKRRLAFSYSGATSRFRFLVFLVIYAISQPPSFGVPKDTGSPSLS